MQKIGKGNRDMPSILEWLIGSGGKSTNIREERKKGGGTKKRRTKPNTHNLTVRRFRKLLYVAYGTTGHWGQKKKKKKKRRRKRKGYRHKANRETDLLKVGGTGKGVGLRGHAGGEGGETKQNLKRGKKRNSLGGKVVRRRWAKLLGGGGWVLEGGRL